MGANTEIWAPLFEGDTFTARVTVISIWEDKPAITLETVCENRNGEQILKGEAVVAAE